MELRERAWLHPYYVVGSYASDAFPFSRLVGRHVGVEKLEQLHDTYAIPALQAENEQTSPLHQLLYGIGSGFAELYRRFVREWVEPTIGAPVVFQSIPNFRFQMPGSMGVVNWHCDRDHGHGANEVNIWVPLTETHESTSVWVECDGGLRYRPNLLSVGQVLVFDGASIRHGNVINQSNDTRVSFEFRVIPEQYYEDREEKSPVMGSRFCLGDYFERFDDRPWLDTASDLSAREVGWLPRAVTLGVG